MQESLAILPPFRGAEVGGKEKEGGRGASWILRQAGGFPHLHLLTRELEDHLWEG